VGTSVSDDDDDDDVDRFDLHKEHFKYVLKVHKYHYLRLKQRLEENTFFL
jgi:hypothetical protein